MLQFSSAGFDASVEQIFSALAHGGHAGPARPGAVGTEELAERIAELGLTVTDQSTAVLQPLGAGRRGRCPPTLRLIGDRRRGAADGDGPALEPLAARRMPRCSTATAPPRPWSPPRSTRCGRTRSGPVPIGRPLAGRVGPGARPPRQAAAGGRPRRAVPRRACWPAATWAGRTSRRSASFPIRFGDAGLAPVPDGRPGPAGGRTGRPRVPGPHRRPGEDPRVPRRAGRDRGRAGRRIPACARPRCWLPGDGEERRLVAFVAPGLPDELAAPSCASACRSP